MKPCVAVALIVVGGLLVIGPVVAEYSIKSKHQDNMARIFEKTGTNSAHLYPQGMDEWIVFVSMLIGALMAAAGVYFTVRPPRTASESSEPKQQSPGKPITP